MQLTLTIDFDPEKMSRTDITDSLNEWLHSYGSNFHSEAFEFLVYLEHEPAVRRYVYRRVANKSDVDDIVAQVFFNAWRAIDSYEERDSMQSWLYRIAHNTVISHYRSLNRRPTCELGLDVSNPDVEFEWSPRFGQDV